MKFVKLIEDTLDLVQNTLLTVGFVTFSEAFESDTNTSVKNFALGGLFIIQCAQFVLNKYKPTEAPQDFDDALQKEQEEQEEQVQVQTLVQVQVADNKQESSCEKSLHVYYPVAKALALANAFAVGIVKSYSDSASLAMLYTAFGSFAALLGVKGVLTIKNGPRAAGFLVLGGASVSVIAGVGTALGNKDVTTNALLAGGGCFLLLTANSARKFRKALREMSQETPLATSYRALS